MARGTRMAADHAADLDAMLAAATAAVRAGFKEDDLLMEHGEEALVIPTVWMSTGSLALDYIMRGLLPGGVPLGPRQGRVVHLFGLWSTGKSLTAEHMAKSVQDAGGAVLIAETEGSRDAHFAKSIGLNLTRLHIQRPRSLEVAFDGFLKWHRALRMAEAKAKAKVLRPVLWILDSLDSSESEKSADKGLSEGGGWQYGGGRSQALSAGLKKVVRECGRFPTSVVLLNQTRVNVGIMFGDKTTTSGGMPPHFFASIEISLKPSPRGTVRGRYKGQKLNAALAKRRGIPVEGKGDVIGAWNRAKITKSKVSGTFLKEADFYVDFRKGIDRYAGLFDVLLRDGITGFAEDNEKKRVWMRTPENKRRSYATEQAWLQACADDPEYLYACVNAATVRTDGGKRKKRAPTPAPEETE